MKTTVIVKYLKVRYLWVLLFLQAVLLIRYLHVTFNPFESRWNDLILQHFIGDEPSYVMFSFASLTSILDNYRSLGLPLLIRIYHIFFNGYQFWPIYTLVLYLASVFFLFWTLLKFGFDKILSFVVASLLLWNIEFGVNTFSFQLYSVLPYINTETPAIAFLNISIGLMLLAIRYNKWVVNLAYALSLFLLYQIRPNESYVAILAPFWAVVFVTILIGFDRTKLKKVFLRFFLTSTVPLLLFGLVRLFVVGQFGFATMTGGTLAGHAVQYLNETNVTKLKGESRVIGEEILRRKRQFSFPCNLSPFSYPVIPDDPPGKTEGYCFGPNLMMAWSVVIKYQTGKEPFDDPAKNIEPWNYIVTLAPFHMTYYHSSTDKILMKFTTDILRLEWKQYLMWIMQGSGYGLKMLFLNKNIYFYYWLFFSFAILVRIIFRLGLFDKSQTDSWKRQILAFSFVVISNFTTGYILLLLFNFPFDRMFIMLTPYMLSVFVLWAIPPFWLKRKND